MPAPSLPALFDFEAQIESAALAILEDAGVVAFISSQQQRLPLISTGIGCDVGPAFDETTFLPLAVGEPPPPYRQEYYRYSASLQIDVSVNRDTNEPTTSPGVASFLGEVRGRIRAALMSSFWPFNDTNLPWLRLASLRPNGTTTGFQQVRYVDTVLLTYALVFGIQPTAWPVGFPAAPTP